MLILHLGAGSNLRENIDKLQKQTRKRLLKTWFYNMTISRDLPFATPSLLNKTSLPYSPLNLYKWSKKLKMPLMDFHFMLWQIIALKWTLIEIAITVVVTLLLWASLVMANY